MALVGPGTGTSTRLGLLEAREPALARGSDGQSALLGSIHELKAWLDQDGLLMNAARWFGESHWFVAIGYDAGGMAVCHSSGWDARFLSWSRLYGEVGFSGWVLGVVA